MPCPRGAGRPALLPGERPDRWRSELFDVLYIVVTVLFFVALLGYAKLCERMGGGA